MPLHIDHRPQTLKEVVGNKLTVTKLESILVKESKPHSFLFAGPSGCGKTTLGRILASALGCLEKDVQEINASNNRGIDTIRDIISTMRYKPLTGVARAYILDEFHQTTKDGQNAILKALEDTPEHVYFILCTTEPQKLLTTIQNRCHRFDVENLNEDELTILIKKTLRKERKRVPTEAITYIAEKAEGCPRLALIMLDDIIDLDESLQIAALQSFKTQESMVVTLCQSLLSKSKWSVLAKILKGIQEEPETVRRAVLGYMTTVMLSKDTPRAAVVFDCFSEPFYNTGKAGLVFACYNTLLE